MHRLRLRSVPVPGLQQQVVAQTTTMEIDPLLRREGTSRNGWQSTADALLTTRSKRQPVAADGNGLALVQAILGVPRAEPLPAVAPLCSIPVPSQLGENAQFSGLRSRRGVFVRTVEPGWVRRRLGFWDPLFIGGVSRFLKARPRVPLNRPNISNAGVASLSISTLSASRARAAKM